MKTFRNVLHVVVAILLWVVFVLYWRLVMARPMNSDTRVAVFALSLLCLAGIVYLTFWILHNKGIARRFKDRRRGRRRAFRDPIQDYLGRWVIVDTPDELRQANYIEVEVKTSVVNEKTVEEKVFRANRPLE